MKNTTHVSNEEFIKLTHQNIDRTNQEILNLITSNSVAQILPGTSRTRTISSPINSDRFIFTLPHGSGNLMHNNFKTDLVDSNIKKIELTIGDNLSDSINGELIAFFREEFNLEPGTLPFNVTKNGLISTKTDTQFIFTLKTSCDVVNFTFDEYDVPEDKKIQLYPVLVYSPIRDKGVYYLIVSDNLDSLNLQLGNYTTSVQVVQKTENYSIFKFADVSNPSKCLLPSDVKFSCANYTGLTHNLFMFSDSTGILRYIY